VGLKKCVFLSDLHIQSDEDVDKFLKFIEKLDADAVFLLGDIFEFLAYDNSQCIKKYEDIIDKLRKISLKGIKVVFVEGNHDFALNGKFVSGSKIEISPEEYIFDLDGKKTVLVHGDVFFINRIFRSLLRSTITKKLVKFIPDALIMKFGFWLSSLGKNKRKIVREEMIERQIRYVIRRFSDADIFVSGHLHIPIIKRILYGKRELLWVNPGGPDYSCEYKNGEFFIKSY